MSQHFLEMSNAATETRRVVVDDEVEGVSQDIEVIRILVDDGCPVAVQLQVIGVIHFLLVNGQPRDLDATLVPAQRQ